MLLETRSQLYLKSLSADNGEIRAIELGLTTILPRNPAFIVFYCHLFTQKSRLYVQIRLNIRETISKIANFENIVLKF